jgi:hypothetical protein
MRRRVASLAVTYGRTRIPHEVGGPGAFVVHVVNYDEFAEAMTNKLITEVSKR